MKKILITGTSRGIGYNLVKHFTSKNYFVYGLSRTQLKKLPENYKHYTIDLSDLKSLDERLNFLKDLEINHFIHNAGIVGQIKKFEYYNLDIWQKVYNVNLFSGVYILQKIFNSLIKSKGCIIFMAGGGSTTSLQKWSSYSTSKTAIVRLVENIADEYKNILHVYAVSPGINKTQLIEDAIKQGHAFDLLKTVPFSFTCKLCDFLINKKDYFLSGRQIHVKDDYLKWKSGDFSNNDLKLRRMIIS